MISPALLAVTQPLRSRLDRGVAWAGALLLWVMMGLGAEAALSRTLWINDLLVGSPEPPSPYSVEPAFANLKLKSPLYLADEPGSDRLWVVLQGGEPDRPSRILSWRNFEQADQTREVFQLPGRLIYGLTFHPGYATNRWVYLFSNGPTGEPSRTNRISRFSVPAGEAPRCDPASERVVLQWFSAGHDGGDLAFGRDGMLYITAGDGSSDSDAYNSGQDVGNLLATLIRIDVDTPDSGAAYSVPRDNPFLGQAGARPEIWAYGFRNPWRMDIDRRTGDVWVGNNGQDLWETAYLVRRGDNYGWSVLEGSHAFYPNRRRGPTPITAPLIEHPHSEFRSLTGGVVYYGDGLPELNGAYVYGDYSTGKIWGARHREGQLTWHQEIADTTLQIVAFRADQRGDLLVVDLGGGIHRVVRRPAAQGVRVFPKRLSEAGLFSSLADHRPVPGLIPYAVNAPAWMDGARGERFIGLPGPAQIQYAATRGWGFTNGSVLVQTLFMPDASRPGAPERRLETRVLVRDENEWQGYSYVWNAEQTEASLAPKEGTNILLSASGSLARQGTTTWRVPSRADCLSCHARAVNYVLGLSQAQMDRGFDYGAGPENQLEVFRHWGVFRDPPKGGGTPLERLVDPYDEDQDVEARARSYLHANCSVCHVEAGGGNARMELERSRSLEGMRVISARPQHDTFGLTNAMILAPGQPDRSVMVYRLSHRGRGQMPPLGSSVVDERAVSLLRRWIAGMKVEARWVSDWTAKDLEPELTALQQGRRGSVFEGKRVFQQSGCVECHRIGGEGGTVGPELTGAARRLGLVGLLESLLDPSKTIAEGYRSQEWELKDGEIITGSLDREESGLLLIRTSSSADGLLRVPKINVASQRVSTVSTMPAGLLNSLERQEIRDLLTYLTEPQ